MKKVNLYLLIIVVVVASFLGGVYFFLKQSPANLQNVDVSLKWKHQAQFAGMYVADTKGFYKEKGIKVNLKEFDFSNDTIVPLLNGESDFSLMSAEEFLAHVSQEDDIVAVAAFYQTSPYSLVSLKEKDIVTPADFLGKTLGNKGAKLEEEIFYLLLLSRFGIEVDDIAMKDLGFEQREIDDLLGGSADVVGLYRTDQLYFFDKENISYNIISPEKFGVNLNNDILVTTKNLITTNPALVENFVKATIKGWEYAVENPDKAIDVTMKYVTDPSYQDREYEAYILQNSIPLIKPSTNQKIGYINPSSFASLYDLMKKSGFLDKEFEVKDFYINDFIY